MKIKIWTKYIGFTKYYFSGIKKRFFTRDKKQNEWFECDLETAKKAITAVKEGHESLSGDQITTEQNPIIFRPEQLEAINLTVKRFKKNNQMLWNAKMRFGKTLTALQVVKEMEFKKTIIITHRPVVERGWEEDFRQIFYNESNYRVGSKNSSSIKTLEKSANNYVYFASMQDLRGSAQVGGNFEKNDIVFSINWDFIIIDEAHEGVKNEIGQEVFNAVKGEDTKILKLSGTPFNLFDEFKAEEIYTWDYVMEQNAKQQWNLKNHLDSNPYEELPKLNIFTYDLNNLIRSYEDQERLKKIET